VKRWFELFAIWHVLVIFGALALGSCGETKSEPITDLNAEQKKQVEELNDQRAKEWAPPKKQQ